MLPDNSQVPSGCAVAVVAGSVPPGEDDLADQLGQGRGEDRVATRHPGQPRLALRGGAEAGDGHGAVDHALDKRARRPPRLAGRLNHEARRHEVETRAPDVLAQADAEEAGVRRLPPQLAVERSFGGLDLLEPVGRGPVGEDPAASSRTASCSSLNEKSICPLQSDRGHAEAEDGDEVALDLVGAAAEGEDDQRAVELLEPRGEHRTRRAVLDVRRRR